MHYKTFNEARLNDASLYRIWKADGTLEEMIVALANEKEQLFKQLIEAKLIMPKKVRTDDGVFVWHCPNELIPEENLQLRSTESE